MTCEPPGSSGRFVLPRLRLRSGRSALLGGWDAHRASGGGKSLLIVSPVNIDRLARALSVDLPTLMAGVEAKRSRYVCAPATFGT